MSGINFNINGGLDPVLASGPDYQAQFAELEHAERFIEQRKQLLMKYMQNTENPQAQQSTPSPTPIWDEIDSITGNMTPNEFQAMSTDPNYQESLQALMEYVSAVQLQMIRPQVEQSPEGRKILEQHLTNVRFLRKAALESVDKKLADFDDYTKNYSHMSWDEYLKAKGGQK